MTFPRHAGKHARRSLITSAGFLRYLRRRGEPVARSPTRVVLAYSPTLVEATAARFRARRLEGPSRLHAVPRLARSVGLCEVRGIGGPALAVTVEELVAAGARELVSIGFAGALRPRLRAGSVVVCSRAIRDEGTSYHYARSAKYAYPSARLTRSLEASLRAADRPHLRGTSWTVDAPYRETREELRRYRAEGVVTLEMEASTLFTVARSLGVEAAALFVVSDQLDEAGWHPRFLEARPHLASLLRFGVETMGRRAARPRSSR